MRDTVEKRKRLNELRRELDAAWLTSRFDSELIASINAELRSLIADEPPPPDYEPWEEPMSDGTTTPAGITPNADHVMLAIGKAAEILNCDPIDVLSGMHSGGERDYLNALAYARYYAALALKEVFGMSNATASRACGVSEASAAVFITSMQRRIKLGECSWFNQSIADDVKQAVKEGMKE